MFSLLHSFSKKVMTPSIIRCISSNGLLGIPNLTSPQYLNLMTQKAVQNVKVYKNELKNTIDVKQKLDYLDALSYCVCDVLDLCTFIVNCHTNTQYQDSAMNCLSQLNNVFAELNSNDDVYNEAEYVYKNCSKLNESDQHCAMLLYNDFQMSGKGIEVSRKENYIQTTNKLDEYNQIFLQNIRDNTDSIPIPSHSLQEYLNHDPHQYRRTFTGSYIVPADHNLYNIIPWVQEESIRKRILEKAETLVPHNIQIFDQILEQRQCLAEIQNHKCYNDLASSQTFLKPNEIDRILYEFMEKLKPCVDHEVDVLKHEKKIYSNTPFSEEDCNYYIGMSNSKASGITANDLHGLFNLKDMIQIHIPSLFRTMFDVDVELKVVQQEEAWCDCKYLYKYNCYDKTNYLGSIYLDLYSRPQKVVNNCTFSIVSRYEDLYHTIHTPLVVVNTMLPLNNDLTYTQCTSLFHELGHATAALLSKSKYQFASGIRVKADFMEVISQIYEYIFTKNVYMFATKNKNTDKYINSIQKVSSRMQGLSNMNMNIHYLFDRMVNSNTLDKSQYLPDVYTSLRSKYLPFPVVKSHSYSSLPHYINYASVFYSYNIGKTMACDIYNTLDQHNNGFITSATGKMLLDNYLQYGGNKDPHDIIHNLLGRDFDIDIYVKEINERQTL